MIYGVQTGLMLTSSVIRQIADQAYEMKGVYKMSVLPPTGDFIINGVYAAVTFFSIILTIYLIRYRFRLEPYEAHTGRVSSAAQLEAHTGLVPSAALAGTSVPVPMCGNEQGKNAVMMSGTSWDESRTQGERRTWGQARSCGRSRTRYQSRTCSVPMGGNEQENLTSSIIRHASSILRPTSYSYIGKGHWSASCLWIISDILRTRSSET